MTHATCPGRRVHDAATFFVHFVHGSLMLTAFAFVAFVGAGYLLKSPVSYADLGVGASAAVAASDTAQAPVVHVPAEMPGPKAVVSAVGLSTEMRGVRDFVAQRYNISTRTLEPLLTAAELSGRKLGIDPLLIVAVMAIESSFNPFAESNMGAQGLMQVIPRFHLDKIGRNAGEDALFDPALNIRVGTMVLVEGMQRFGSLQNALQYYGGALSDPNASYANKVLAMKKRLVTAATRAKTETGA
ncbi:transglycosylase SLT domain-containing protein [Aromatoleum toluclasticum]|uniref:transglycosylase SLT domain-containing protein n=1 Tax=Aromatoleum toluclasticum TaxID=92003 RepID=UPI0003A2DB10|nr:transglycosylase SLT domain-containing protein [Aromatoleum toluclasticum]